MSEPRGEYFAASDEVSFVPATLDADERTVDVVWYGGATVPRVDPDTGDQYMLQLDMAGARLDRLNNGAPVFDNHMNGTDVRSVMSNKAGTRAQVGVVQKAWADGPKGMATLKFRPEGQDEDSDRIWSGIQSGIIRNLSFGTWLYAKEPQDASNGETSNVFTATDWEPFEISAVSVPADFTTTFLSATLLSEKAADQTRATRPYQETIVMETTTQAGGDARNDQVVLDAARAEGTRLERQRVSEITSLGASFKLEKLAASLVAAGVSIEDAKLRFAGASEIRTIGAPMLKFGVPQQFIDGLIDEGVTLDAARAKIQDELGEQLPARLLPWLGIARRLPDPGTLRVGRPGLRRAVCGARAGRIDRVLEPDQPNHRDRYIHGDPRRQQFLHDAGAEDGFQRRRTRKHGWHRDASDHRRATLRPHQRAGHDDSHHAANWHLPIGDS